MWLGSGRDCGRAKARPYSYPFFRYFMPVVAMPVVMHFRKNPKSNVIGSDGDDIFWGTATAIAGGW